MKARLSCEGFPPDELNELERTDASLIPRVGGPCRSISRTWPTGTSCATAATGCAPSTRQQTAGPPMPVPADQKVMFSGDHLLMNSSPNMAPFPGARADSLATTCAADRWRSCRWSSPAWGTGSSTRGAQAEAMPERIAWLQRHHRQRLDEIAAQLEERPA